MQMCPHCSHDNRDSACFCAKRAIYRADPLRFHRDLNDALSAPIDMTALQRYEVP
jgi:hypothetical protein